MKAWYFLIIALIINSVIGYVLGGFSLSGKYFGQVLFYGLILLGMYYLVYFIYKKSKESKNLILK